MKKILILLLLGNACLYLVSCTKDDSTDDDDVTGNWIRKSDFEGLARSEAVSFVIQDRAYLGTGYDGTDRLRDFWAYDAASNFWVQVAEFPGVARNSAVGFAIQNKGYVGTGYDGNNRLRDFWEYDPATNTWIQRADFGGSARYDAVGFGIGTKGYITTGYDGNALKDFWEYDPQANQWTQRISMGGTKRSAAVAFVHNNKAYLVSGINNGETVNDFWCYDPSTSTWSEKRKIVDASSDDYDDDYALIRYNAAAFVIGDKAYLTSGESGGLTSTTWEYDVATDLWTLKTSLEGAARTGATGFGVSGKGFIATGRNSNYRFDDLREFYPSMEYDEND